MVLYDHKYGSFFLKCGGVPKNSKVAYRSIKWRKVAKIWRKAVSWALVNSLVTNNFLCIYFRCIISSMPIHVLQCVFHIEKRLHAQILS